jgi:hypothetical protein
MLTIPPPYDANRFNSALSTVISVGADQDASERGESGNFAFLVNPLRIFSTLSTMTASMPSSTWCYTVRENPLQYSEEYGDLPVHSLGRCSMCHS